MGHQALNIPTVDGQCQARLFRPEAEAAGAIILYMDAFGPRPALWQMAERLTGLGYAVLVPDLLYRYPDRGEFDAKTTFSDPERGPFLRSMLQATTQTMTIADTGAFLGALVDNGLGGPVATVGYCMGGARALNAAAHYPDRVVAAASFHGGNLAGANEDSPHRVAGRIKARVMVGVAGVDQSFPPEQSAMLAQALREAEVDHIIENYVGCQHGWCVPDSRVHDPAGAERHWKRLAVFLDETLGTR
jgi:carboxymethylenebutenolidase